MNRKSPGSFVRKLETIMGWIFILGCMISGTKIFANDTQQTPSTQFSETERESLNELLVTSGLKAKLTDELKDDDLLWIIGLLVKDNAPGTSQEDLRPVAIEALKYIVARHRNDKDGKIPDSTADLLNKSDNVWGEVFEEKFDYIVSQASPIFI